jgi:HK97 gp10 family phage protein
MTTKILNADKLVRKLRALPARAEALISAAMAQSADQTVSLMKSLAPVDNGDLQMSISWTWGDAPKGSLKIGQIKSREGNLRITVFAGGGDAYYVRFTEFGRRPFIAGGRFAGAQVPATPAQPFFYTGFRATRKSARSRISRAITRAAKEIAASG